MTAFSALSMLCGLSQREAAAFLGVSPSAVDKMGRGVRSTPPGVMAELRGLHRQQRRAATAIIRQWSEAVRLHGAPDRLELALSSDDAEAQSKGWPCVGAERAAYALALARIDAPAVIVPRGSTVATAWMPFTAVRNPTREQFAALFAASASRTLRRIQDGDGYWYWPCEQATHAKGAERLGVAYSRKPGEGDIVVDG